jgi:hypothetical protein
MLVGSASTPAGWLRKADNTQGQPPISYYFAVPLLNMLTAGLSDQLSVLTHAVRYGLHTLMALKVFPSADCGCGTLKLGTPSLCAPYALAYSTSVIHGAVGCRPS